MDKKEKEIEDAYSSWEQRQFKQKIEYEEKISASKKKENCLIYW